MTILREAVVRLPDGRNLGYAEHGVHDGIPVLCFHGMPGGRFYDLAGYSDDVRRFRTDPEGLRQELGAVVDARRAAWLADPDEFFGEWLLLWPEIDRGAFVKDRSFWERVFAATYGGPGTVDEWVVQAAPFGFSPEAIAVPVHAWHGDADEAAPLALVERLIGRVQHGTLTVCPGEGHHLSRRHHAEMCAVLAAAA